LVRQWGDHLYRVLDDAPSTPGTSPVRKNGLFRARILQSSHETLLGLCVAAGQQEGEPIQVRHIFLEDLAEIC